MEEGKLSHLRIEQREGTIAETDEKPGEKDGEKGGEELDSEETWEPRDLDVDGVFVAIGQCHVTPDRANHVCCRRP